MYILHLCGFIAFTSSFLVAILPFNYDSHAIIFDLIFFLPVNGQWTDWTFWSGCSVTCGSGHKIRQRYCLNPAPSNGGLACSGLTTDQVSCSVMGCPGKNNFKHRNCVSLRGNLSVAYKIIS